MRYLKNYIADHLLKVTILGLLLGAIYLRVNVEGESAWSVYGIGEAFQRNGWLMLLVFLLMPLNWGLEALKWQKLINTTYPVSFWRAVRAIYAGVCMGLFTPNRIGEYGGRLMLVPSSERLKAVKATLVGSLAQLIVTGVAGLVGFTVLANFYYPTAALPAQQMYGLSTLLIVALLGIYFYSFRWKGWLLKLPLPQKVQKFLADLPHYEPATLSSILNIATLRYAVYCVQYFLLLKVFGADITFTAGFAAITTIFLIQTLIPNVALLQLGVTGNIALLVLLPLGLQPVVILSAVFALWLVNLMLPSLLGFGVILQEKLVSWPLLKLQRNAS